MADADYSLLSDLKSAFPSLPIKLVLRIMQKYKNDHELCKQALALEAEKLGHSSDCNSETSSVGSASETASNSNNLESPAVENKSIATRVKELKVCHEGSSQSKPAVPERHVSTIERSITATSRLSDTKPPPPLVGQSVSWTLQTTDRPAALGATAQPHRGPNNTTPQTAPVDFSPFFKSSTTDIPNIDCKTSGVRPQQISITSSSASSSPGEQRHPVKVITIPRASMSGGSVSPAATPPNSRHYRMHFGDTGGICTVSTPPSNMQRYGPQVSQHYRSEIRTEATVPQPVHSSSIVVNTTSHTNHLTVEGKPNSNSDSSGNGRRTPNPPLNLNTTVGQSQSAQGFSPGKPLSTPVQASSPGISHSKPVFVETKKDSVSVPSGHGGYNDTGYHPSGIFPIPANVRPPPTSGIFSMNFPRYNPEFAGSVGYFSQIQDQPFQQPQNPHTGYTSPPTNLYQPTSATGYNPNSYNFHGMGFPMTGPVSMTGQTSSHLSHYSHYSPHGSHSPAHHMPKSPNLGMGQRTLGSRSSSQDSEHSVGGPDYDPRHNLYTMNSRVSSHSSLNSDSSSNRIDREHVERPRSGSFQEEADYIQALLQHQKSRMQKLADDMNQHKTILNNLRSEVCLMEKNMIENNHVNKSFPSVEDISQLCEKNRSLQTDIQMYMNEIDMYKSGQTPYNKITAQDQQNFFENMPTGQQDPIYSRTPDGRRSPSPQRTPPPRPPPPIPVRQRSTDTGQASGGNADMSCVPPVPPLQPVIHSGDSEEGESWNCSACTFSNHPALKKCEMCEMPRVMPPHPASATGPPALPPHLPLGSMPPRMAPGIMGNIRPRSGSPHAALGHHHHRAGT